MTSLHDYQTFKQLEEARSQGIEITDPDNNEQFRIYTSVKNPIVALKTVFDLEMTLSSIHYTNFQRFIPGLEKLVELYQSQEGIKEKIRETLKKEKDRFIESIIDELSKYNIKISHSSKNTQDNDEDDFVEYLSPYCNLSVLAEHSPSWSGSHTLQEPISSRCINFKKLLSITETLGRVFPDISDNLIDKLLEPKLGRHTNVLIFDPITEKFDASAHYYQIAFAVTVLASRKDPETTASVLLGDLDNDYRSCYFQMASYVQGLSPINGWMRQNFPDIHQTVYDKLLSIFSPDRIRTAINDFKEKYSHHSLFYHRINRDYQYFVDNKTSLYSEIDDCTTPEEIMGVGEKINCHDNSWANAKYVLLELSPFIIVVNELKKYAGKTKNPQAEEYEALEKEITDMKDEIIITESKRYKIAQDLFDYWGKKSDKIR